MHVCNWTAVVCRRECLCERPARPGRLCGPTCGAVLRHLLTLVQTLHEKACTSRRSHRIAGSSPAFADHKQACLCHKRRGMPACATGPAPRIPHIPPSRRERAARRTKQALGGACRVLVCAMVWPLGNGQWAVQWAEQSAERSSRPGGSRTPPMEISTPTPLIDAAAADPRTLELPEISPRR